MGNESLHFSDLLKNIKKQDLTPSTKTQLFSLGSNPLPVPDFIIQVENQIVYKSPFRLGSELIPCRGVTPGT